MGFVPHVADTFFIQVKSSIEQKKGEAFEIKASFLGTKQNLDLITPHDYWNKSYDTQSGLYAFVVHWTRLLIIASQYC
ncbi:MAG: hypothetical protein KBB37_01795 [Bacteroidia bacterium]|nr:hypothetical protein [Bacteroidia bacterium]MBP7259991.1 hypothetical protein [Bacteroidia bacterium]MBP9179698.1 hypothetical protein [Bacteroidia bacterium]MBP9723903.1 hypothetical protein [Bacteroidia bacterium]